MPAPPPSPEDLHEWVSFEDPDEDRTWIFDLTFLTANWTCIYGRGCPGVLDGPAPELEQGCCSYGAHFTGDEPTVPTSRRRRRSSTRRVAVHQEGARSEAADLRQQGRRDGQPRRRRRLHLPQPPRLPRRRRLRPARRRPPPGERSPTGSPRCAGRCRSAAPTRPTTTATSRRRSASGSGATGARAARSSTGGAPDTELADAFVGHHPVWVACRDEIVAMTIACGLRAARRVPARAAGSSACSPIRRSSRRRQKSTSR